jgi:aldehyde:ferredoxin oxidoreductase
LEELKLTVLNVDLSTGDTRVDAVRPDWLRSYLGGSSLAARWLYEELTADLDPLSPEAPLMFMTGPLTGTKGPAMGRYVVCARSPGTGIWGESNCGGFFGPALRAAGYDGLVLRGRAPDPSSLLVRDGDAEIHDASELWGVTDTYETQSRLREQFSNPRMRIANIGVAGETQIPFASILCDHGRLAGRTGMGAVMGSKHLKAIAVDGHRVIPLAHADRFGPLRSAVNRGLREDNITLGLRQTGTAGVANYLDYLGILPKKYYRQGSFDGVEQVSGAMMADTILSGVSTCHGCVIACGRKVRLGDGVERKGPEHETIAGFGPNLLISDLPAITRMGEWCDRYGMDSISLSNTIGLAFTLYERGIIDGSDTDGLVLEWGNAEAAQTLIHQTARRQGLGELIARGARGLAAAFGVPEMAVQVHGLEVAYHDPRGASGMALVYATSPRGACHNQSDYYLVEIGGAVEEIGVKFHRRHGGAEKAASVARHQDWRSVGSSLVMCQFANVEPADLVRLINACTGLDYDLGEIMEVGERAWNIKRVINHRLGLRGADDQLPPALAVPLADGGSAGYVPPFREMLEAYYRSRGWDAESGKPTPARLRRLGLGALTEDIW